MHTYPNTYTPVKVIFKCFFGIFNGVKEDKLVKLCFFFLTYWRYFHRFPRSNLPSLQSVPMAPSHLSFHSTSRTISSLNLIPFPLRIVPIFVTPTPIFQIFSHACHNVCCEVLGTRFRVVKTAVWWCVLTLPMCQEFDQHWLWISIQKKLSNNILLSHVICHTSMLGLHAHCSENSLWDTSVLSLRAPLC